MRRHQVIEPSATSQVQRRDIRVQRRLIDDARTVTKRLTRDYAYWPIVVAPTSTPYQACVEQTDRWSIAFIPDQAFISSRGADMNDVKNHDRA